MCYYWCRRLQAGLILIYHASTTDWMKRTLDMLLLTPHTLHTLQKCTLTDSLPSFTTHSTTHQHKTWIGQSDWKVRVRRKHNNENLLLNAHIKTGESEMCLIRRKKKYERSTYTRNMGKKLNHKKTSRKKASHVNQTKRRNEWAERKLN